MWLRGEGCPLDEQTCREAARGGHLAALVWAREAGCPWGASTARKAARCGHRHWLRWAIRNDCPVDDEGETADELDQSLEPVGEEDDEDETIEEGDAEGDMPEGYWPAPPARPHFWGSTRLLRWEGEFRDPPLTAAAYP